MNSTDPLADLDEAFAAEIESVSHVSYNSNAICRWFYSNLRKRLASRAPAQAPEGEIPDSVIQAIRRYGDAKACLSMDVAELKGALLDSIRAALAHRATAQAPEQPVHLTPTLRSEPVAADVDLVNRSAR